MPETAGDKIKNFFWSILRPLWPTVSKLAKALGYRPYGSRQAYIIGELRKGTAVDALRDYLLKNGFVKDEIAWNDDGQVLGLRRLESFRYQHHLRVYDDMVVGAHYELTPEYDPIGHLKDKETEPPRPEFLELLERYVEVYPASTRSSSAPATLRGLPSNG